jgi:hypothetical protein
MNTIDMILQCIPTLIAYFAFETTEVPNRAFGDVHVSYACRV